jgi:hypothetical protein
MNRAAAKPVTSGTTHLYRHVQQRLRMGGTIPNIQPHGKKKTVPFFFG